MLPEIICNTGSFCGEDVGFVTFPGILGEVWIFKILYLSNRNKNIYWL